MVRRVMLVHDPLGMFMLMASMAENSNMQETLGNDEIAFSGFPEGNVIVQAENGNKKNLNNKPDYLEKIVKYGGDTSCAYVKPRITHELGIDNGDIVYIDSI